MASGDDQWPDAASGPEPSGDAAVVAWLESHTNFEVDMPTGRVGAPTLDRMRELCTLVGDPQLACPVVHITGTNGKGSVARMVTELLMAKGLRVGTYTSPDLVVVNERIARDHERVPDDELVEELAALRLLEPVLTARPTRFELLTAAAFRWFADVAVDVCVVEVGLGGRWDATNVVEPDVAVVTNVSEDHLELLGPTLADVAAEKAGIVKPGCRLVVGETDPALAGVFVRAGEAVGVGSTWRRGAAPGEGDFGCDRNELAVGGRLVGLRTPAARYADVYLSLHGAHQGTNAAVALAAVEAFFGAPVEDDAVTSALGRVAVPGRLEVLGHGPLVVIDGAHNPAGAGALAAALTEGFQVVGPMVAVVGLLGGRDAPAMLGPLASAGVGHVVACPAPSPRSMATAEVAAGARAAGCGVSEAPDVASALAEGLRRAGDHGLLVATGSLYVVGAARDLLGTPSSAPGVDRLFAHR